MSAGASDLQASRCGKPHPAFLCLLAVLLLGACGGGGPAETGEDEAAGPADQSYTVRGEVVAVAPPDRERRGLRQLRVRHEAIPDFVGFEGEVVGMASMTMPFPVAPDVSLEGIGPGDPVELTFEVRWEASPPLRIVGLRKLPPGTELDFETEEPLPGEGEVENEGSKPP